MLKRWKSSIYVTDHLQTDDNHTSTCPQCVFFHTFSSSWMFFCNNHDVIIAAGRSNASLVVDIGLFSLINLNKQTQLNFSFLFLTKNWWGDEPKNTFSSVQWRHENLAAEITKRRGGGRRRCFVYIYIYKSIRLFFSNSFSHLDAALRNVCVWDLFDFQIDGQHVELWEKQPRGESHEREFGSGKRKEKKKKRNAQISHQRPELFIISHDTPEKAFEFSRLASDGRFVISYRSAFVSARRHVLLFFNSLQPLRHVFKDTPLGKKTGVSAPPPR